MFYSNAVEALRCCLVTPLTAEIVVIGWYFRKFIIGPNLYRDKTAERTNPVLSSSPLSKMSQNFATMNKLPIFFANTKQFKRQCYCVWHHVFYLKKHCLWSLEAISKNTYQVENLQSIAILCPTPDTRPTNRRNPGRRPDSHLARGPHPDCLPGLRPARGHHPGPCLG